MSDKIEVNRRRVLGGLVTIGAAGAAVGAGTFAAFSDTEDSNDNTIQAGTVAIGDSTAAGFGVTTLAPGDSVQTTIEATYDGSIESEISVESLTLGDNDGTPNDTPISETDFAKYLEVDTATLSIGGQSTNIAPSSDGNGNSRVDLADLAANSPYTANDTATQNDQIELTINLTFVDVSGQNDAQADGVDVDVTLRADQA